jgi:ribosome maturation factor RimP
MDIVAKVTALVNSHLPGDEYFVVEVKASESKVRNKVTILIDADAGIGIDDLTNLSRAIETDLEIIMPTAFTLEVSSPGVDTPLVFARMYKKNIGRNLKVVFVDGQTLKGELKEAGKDSFVLLPEKKKKSKEAPQPQTIAYDTVKTAKVEVSFK